MATHSRIPWTEKPAGLQSTELQRVGHNGEDLAHTHPLIITRSALQIGSTIMHKCHDTFDLS